MRRAECIVRIDGQDISSTILPYLMDLSISDKAGGSSDTCTIRLNDKDSQLLLPEEDVELEVLMGDAGSVVMMFKGKVDEVRSSLTRSEGQVISVSAKGVDTKGKAKEPRQKHWNDKTFGEVVKEAGEAAGISDVQVDESLASIKRSYWAMQGESYLHWAERTSREIGGTFKVVGNRAIVAKRNGGTSVTGEALPTIIALRPGNLIGWDIAPVLGRPRYRRIRARYYDQKKASWQEKEIEVEGDDSAEADLTLRFSADDEDDAEAKATAAKGEVERGKGAGSITIDGTNEAQPEGQVVLTGSRPGIDGTYLIDSVETNYTRGSGWTTRLDVKKPSGSAGTDNRATSE